MSEPSSVHLAYDGEALRIGSMDARELAPALLAVSEACEHANRILNGESARLSVKVRSEFERGSFGFNLDIFQDVQQALIGDNYRTAKEILWLLGLGSPGVGVLWLIKKLRGRKPESITALPGDMVEISVNDSEGTKIEVVKVNAKVMILFSDQGIREAMSGVVKPLDAPGIDTFSVMDGNKTVETVRKDEVSYFTPPIPDEVVVSDRPLEGSYEIVKLSFTDRYKWAFTDGNAGFTADVEDEDFFKRVQNREYSFAKGDYLNVRMRVVTFRSSKGLRSEYRIVRVLDVVRSPTQLSFLPTQEAPRFPPAPRRGRKPRRPSRG